MRKNLTKLSKLFLCSSLTLAHAESMPDFSTDDHEAVISSICESKAPLVIIDFFNARPTEYGDVTPKTKMIDLDNDGTQDLAHGDLVAQVAELTGKSVITYGVREDYNTFSEQDMVFALEDIAQLVEEKRMPKPAGIIYSSDVPLSIAEINGHLNEIGVIIDGKPPQINSKNFAHFRPYILSILNDLYERSGYPQYKEFNYAISRLHSMDIPVIVGAGNGYSTDKINIMALEGALPIGALKDDGISIAPLSNVNSLTTQYRIGYFNFFASYGGLDMNGDKVADIPASMLSNVDLFFETPSEPSVEALSVVSGTSFAAPNICA